MKFTLHSTYRLMLLFHSYLYCLNCVLSLWFAVPCFALALLWCMAGTCLDMTPVIALTYTRPADVIRLHVLWTHKLALELWNSCITHF